MSRFNPEDYENVETRIRRFYDLHPEGRIVTEWVDFAQEESKPWRWMFKASIYLTLAEQDLRTPKATGYASEMETGPQAQWAAELAETSAIGRALANMNLSGNKRASREEMEKVQRAEKSQALFDAISLEAMQLQTKEAAQTLWLKARDAKAPQNLLDEIAAIGAKLA